MERKVSLVLACFLALCLARSANAAATFTLGFEGAPTGNVNGNPGEVMTYEIYPTVTTSNNTSPDGAQGWQIGWAMEGAAFTAVSLKGVIVDIIYDEDLQDGSPIVHHDHYDQDLSGKDMFNKGAFPASLAGAEPWTGAMGWAVFRSTEHAVLQPTGTARMMKATITATIPQTGCTPVRLFFQDGMKSATSKPVANGITFASESIDFTKGLLQQEATWNMCKTAGPEPTLIFAAVVKDGQPAESGDTSTQIEVPADQPSTVDVDVMLISKNLITMDGPQGWQISVAAEKGCMTADGVTLKGMIVDTIYDEDLQDGSPLVHHEHYPQDLSAKDMFNKGAALAFVESDPNQKGAISWAVFKGTEHQVLYPNAKDRILRLTFGFPAVAAGASKTCKVFFLDNLKSDVSKPVSNAITYQSESIDSSKGLVFQNLNITVKGASVATPGQFIRGNANNDSKIDIADAVWIVYSVLKDPNYSLPCMDAGDVDADKLLGFADAVAMINYQFKHGATPNAPFPACGADGATPVSCPKNSTNCP